MKARYAAIDVGTNSINLLVTDDAGSVITREGHVERLGERLHQDKVLSDNAVARALSRITSYVQTINELGVDKWKVVITAPGRLANNSEAFVEAVRAIAGDRVEVVSGQREAELSFRGAAPTEIQGGSCLIDIGGGSTEFALGIGDSLRTFSIPVGAVTLSAAHLHSDPPRPEELTNALGEVNDHLDDVLREMPNITVAAQQIGVAGTIVTIAAVEIGLLDFDADQLEGFVLTKEAAEDVFRTLATENIAERRLNPGLPAARADVIVGGCCILVAFMRRLGLAAITVSVRNLLDGVINELRQQS